MTQPTAAPATAKALLAQLLRTVRQQSQYRTQEALAAAIGKERTTVGKNEQGDRVPALDVLGDTLAACGVTGLAEAAIRGVWWLAKLTEEDSPVKIWFVGWVDAEGRAHTLRYWSPLLVPGIVQTPEYAREVYRAGGRNRDRAAEEVQARMRRQEIMNADDAPTIVIVLWEPVLYHQVGTAEVMHGQLAKLLEVSERPGVLVHVLPSEFGANAGLGGPVSIASVTGKPDVLLTSSLIEDLVTSDVQQVRTASATFETVRGVSANIMDTRRIISEAMTEWENRSRTGARPA
jgi:DNA-binding XRE family transcriptional regulator